MQPHRTDLDAAYRNRPAEPEAQDAATLRHYLLGRLAPPEVEEIENRLFEDDELFELAEAIEAELLDAEARGELAPSAESPLHLLGNSAWGRRRRDFSGALAAIDLRGILLRRNWMAALVKKAALPTSLAAALVAMVVFWPSHSLPPVEIHPAAVTRALQSFQPTQVREGVEDARLILDVTRETAAAFDVKVSDSGTERVIQQFTNVVAKGQPNGRRELRLLMKAQLLPPGSYLVELRQAGQGSESEPLDFRRFSIVRP